MGVTTRPSNPAITAVGRSLESNRDHLVRKWADWLAGRMSQVPIVNRDTIERQLALLVDIVIETTGPLRRQVAELWFNACDTYGRTAAARGLAAGEVVEELQHLRELLIRDLSEVIAALPSRQSLTAVLRLNRLLDKGISHAVVGYTDVLVETLLNQRGVVLDASEGGEIDIVRMLAHLEDELAALKKRRV
ncbi:MAG: hypothetical protein ACE5HT_12730 [Gemmatimonadales bacterium]